MADGAEGHDAWFREPIKEPMAAKILSDVMTRHVDTVAPGCLLSTAAWIMKDDRISSLVVVADGEGVGILTERDIVRAIHLGHGYETRVAEAMGRPLIVVGSSMEFHAAVRLAGERGVRHLVVVDETGAPMGICTDSDFRFHLNHTFFARHPLVDPVVDREPVLVSPQVLVRDVADRLIGRGTSAAVVVEGRRAVGVVSERTLARAVALDVAPTTPVVTLMAPPVCIRLGDSLFDASRLMQSSRRRHLVVVDEFGRVAGLLAESGLVALLRQDDEGREAGDRRFIDKQRRSADERLRLSLEAVEDGLWDWDIAADHLYLSPLGYGLLGYLPDDLPDITFAIWQERVHPDDFADAWAAIESCVDAGMGFCVDFRLRRKGGDWLWVHCRGKVVDFDADGHPRRMVGTVSDATDRIRILGALREREGRYRSILAAMAEGVMVHGADGRVVECNPAAERILGLPAEQIRGRDPADFLWRLVPDAGSPAPAEGHPATVALRSGAPVRDVVMGVARPDGSLSWIRINAEPQRIDPNGPAHGVVATFSDITPFFSPAAGLGV